MTTRSAAAELGLRLYWRLAATPFWCDICHGCHPLREHRDCRDQSTRRHAAKARKALTDALGETT